MKLYPVLSTLLLATALAAPVEAAPMGGEHPSMDHEHQSMGRGEPVTGQSVYQLDSTWTDQHGVERQLDRFRGSVVVLAMVYTHCDYACPRIISDMRRIRREVDAENRDIRFVLVSIDPEGDTVERLASFGEETGLTGQGWSLLRSNEGDVRELAAVFGVQYRRVSETDFAHSNVISVLDREGEIAHQQVGLGATSDPAIAAIGSLLAQPAE
jgi:protein SCO1/2